MEQMFDLYVWLARHFPEEFYELDEALAALEVTQQLIDESLERMGRHGAPRKPMSRKQPMVGGKQQPGTSGHDNLLSIAELDSHWGDNDADDDVWSIVNVHRMEDTAQQATPVRGSPEDLERVRMMIDGLEQPRGSA